MKSFLFVLILSCQTVGARELALTFDDCPRKTGKLMTGMERAKLLVQAIHDAGIERVAFFCNSPEREPDGRERIKFFAQAGHFIANHTATHPWLKKTALKAYQHDITEAEKDLRNFPNFRKWFRFPFLDEGETPEKVLAIRKFLKQRGYTNGYVTVDNEDWYMDDLLGRAVTAGRTFHKERLCNAYSKMISDEADFYDNMSLKALGRSVRQVVLLHETDLNALCLGRLIVSLKNQGWKIISPELAYQDPIAAHEPSAKVPLNQGRIFALAREKGYKGPYWSPWNEEKDIESEFDKAGVFDP